MRSVVMQVNVPEEITTFAKTTFLSFLVLLNLEANQLGYLLILIFIDTFFGLLKSARLKDEISFGRFIWGMLSKLGILLIPLLLASFALFFGINLFFLVQGFIYLIAANDLVSIITNIACIRSAKRYKNIDFIERGIHMLTDYFSTFVDYIVSKVQKVMNALKKDE